MNSEELLKLAELLDGADKYEVAKALNEIYYKGQKDGMAIIKRIYQNV